MRVYETHLVRESYGDSDHHVINVRDSGTYACKLLTVGEPKINTDVLSSNDFEVHVHVSEVTGKGSTGSSHSDVTGLDNNFNCCGKRKWVTMRHNHSYHYDAYKHGKEEPLMEISDLRRHFATTNI